MCFGAPKVKTYKPPKPPPLPPAPKAPPPPPKPAPPPEPLKAPTATPQVAVGSQRRTSSGNTSRRGASALRINPSAGVNTGTDSSGGINL